MLPIELKEEILKLPETDNHNIIIMTGNLLRHKRFAYRIQKEFGNLVVAWYELDSAQKVRYAREEELFKKEIEELEAFSTIKPKKINPLDVHSEEFVNEVKKINPYFFLTLGGPLYTKPLLQAARGIAINQHAGHSPILKGSSTTEWALYHRNIKYVSSTVHITTSGADAGPILRRSNPCMFPNDSYEKIFSRVVALGTELMIEVVHDIIKDKRLVIFKQPREMGRTYLQKEFNHNIRNAIVKDFKAGWLSKELSKLRQF